MPTAGVLGSREERKIIKRKRNLHRTESRIYFDFGPNSLRAPPMVAFAQTFALSFLSQLIAFHPLRVTQGTDFFMGTHILTQIFFSSSSFEFFYGQRLVAATLTNPSPWNIRHKSSSGYRKSAT